MTTRETLEKEWQSNHPGWLRLSSFLDTTESLFEQLLLLPGYELSSNTYAITGAEISLVDAGNDYTAFVDLFRMGIPPTDIRKIVITHGHRDHAMGALELIRSYPGTVEKGGIELILHEAGPTELKEAGKKMGARITEVRGGETLTINDLDWEVIHTPGHTIDGICLFHPESGTAFTGDTVLPHAMAEPDENAGGRLDYYLSGLRALLGKDIKHVLPGHGLPVVSAGRKVVEETYEGLMMKIIGVEAETKAPWIDGAAALAGKGYLEEAVYCCARELAFDPKNKRALKLTAVCLNDLGRFHEALESLEILEGIGPPDQGDPFPYIGKGYALMGIGRYGDSVRLFDEALQVRPGMKEALIYKGMSLYLSGDYEEAMNIGPFRTEFMGRFREELEKRSKGPARPEGVKREGNEE
jgi:glyoxylase-like metal-dependent hydrolase (beta-lactamase superfamily II)